MTTTTARRDIHEAISADIRRIEDMQRRMDRPNDWRADALERAGELALGGRLAESRRVAQQFTEE